MSIGKIGEFIVKTGTWSSYVDRLDMYFKVNGIKDELKVPTMISIMGDEAYELLVNLASPKKPSELTYSAACELLCNHLQPTPSLLAERYRFRQRRQRADENTAEYVAELKRLARDCKFKETLEDNLRDLFVCGLKSDVIRQRLFAKDETLTFMKAVKLANALEAAERDAAAVEVRGGGGGMPETAEVHAIDARGARSVRVQWARGGGGAQRGDPQHGAAVARRAPSENCKGCGATGHNYGTCRFRDYVCSRCKRTGHLRRVCPSAAGPSGAARPAAGGSGGGGRGFHYGRAAADESDADGEPEEDFDLHQLCLRDYKVV